MISAWIETIRKNRIQYAGFMIFYMAAATVIAVCDVWIARSQGSIGQAATEASVQHVLHYLLIMAAITGVKVLCSAISTFYAKRWGGRTGYVMRQNFAAHFTRMPYEALSQKNSGEILSLYTNDLPAASNYITASAPQQLTQIAALLVSALFMAMMNLWLTLIFFALYPVLIVLQSKISKPIGRHMQDVSLYRAEFNAVVHDSLQNPSTVITYSLEDMMEKRYLASYDKYYKVFMRYVTTLLTLAISGILASFLPQLILGITAGIYVSIGQMTVAEYIAFLAIANSAGSWLSMLSQNLGQLQVGAANAKRIGENTSESLAPIPSGGEPMARPEAGVPAITFHDVVFGYTAEKQVLQSLSFEIPQGKKVAIVGSSGCGKSTILKLLLALYTPGSGRIDVMGDALTPESLRHFMAYVPQDSFLLPASIQENIVGNMPFDQKKLERVCADAGILSFIQSLPDGWNTILSESSENISGGQRQRIAMARAFYRDAPIILLDEATSALDPVTEKAVLDSFYASAEGKTALVVAHRAAAVSSCDWIIVLDQGKVAEMGTHDDLIQKDSIYAALYKGGASNA